jgi:ribosomal protein S27AE
MNIQKMSCPNCGASISVTEDLNQLNCAHCGSTLSIQRGDGYAALKMAEKLGQTIQDSSAQTQGTIRDGTQVTQLELKRLQINQDITTAQLQLSNIQAEIRGLEREKPTGKIKQQLRELRLQEASIRSRIMSLQAALLPETTSSVAGAVPPTMTSTPASKPWYRSFVKMTLLFLFLMPVWAGVILWDKKQSVVAKVVAGFLLVMFMLEMVASMVRLAQ